MKKCFVWPSFHNSQQLFGDKNSLIFRNQLNLNLYKSLATRKECIWNSDGHTGGIFNLEYSPDGCLLLAATENKKILMFSSNTYKLVDTVDRAHKSCVNLIKFVDLRTFVTCSDDCTLGIWDLRNLKQKIKSLRGHKNWVKSIEFDKTNGVLLSAAYDQTVLKWDINSSSNIPQNVLQIKNMLRMVLTPDSTKMIISTADGYLLIIHDLNLNTLSHDLRDFVPDLYRLMQDKRNCGIDMGSWVNPLFTAKQNRVELISDFPDSDQNGYITTLDVHPFGWTVLSRNTAGNELSEWTCVHDIQSSDKPLEVKPIKRLNYLDTNSSNKISNSDSNANYCELHSNDFSNDVNTPIIVISNQIGSSEPHTSVLSKNCELNTGSEGFFYKNHLRLKYFIEELNENQGFIKELCFSSDGRVICSPHQFGFRLLSFDNNCSEMCDCLSDKPKLLYELKQSLCHSDYVVTTKFSPTQCQIASGCLKGRVVFTQPIF